jgi:hypothetical protein
MESVYFKLDGQQMVKEIVYNRLLQATNFCIPHCPKNDGVHLTPLVLLKDYTMCHKTKCVELILI